MTPTLLDFMWIVTGLSIVGTILNIKRLKCCFIVWLATNFIWCIYDYYIGNFPQAVLFAVYVVLAIWGIYEWYKNTPERIYLVGWRNAEEQFISKACKSKETALKEWDRIRLNLIEENLRTYYWDLDSKLYRKIKFNLSETDPDKMDNYPHDEPFIQEIDLE